MTDIARSAGESAEHLTDADLIRLLDGEPSLSAVPDVAAHLQGCRACTERRDLLTDRRRRLATLLGVMDHAVPERLKAAAVTTRARPPRPWYTRPALRAAGLLLLAGALAAQPAVRRWLVEQRNRAASRGAPATSVGARTEMPTSREPVIAGSALSFEPGPGPFTIYFEGRPAGGALIIVGVEGSRVTAERLSGANLELLVMPRGLRVRDAAGATASYLVRVPRSVSRVRVRFDASPSASDVDVDVGTGHRRVVAFGP